MLKLIVLKQIIFEIRFANKTEYDASNKGNMYKVKKG